MTTDVSACADLNRALYDALVNDLHAIDPLFRPHARWVMNPAWLEVIKKMADPAGEAYWREGATHLLGLPFAVTGDGGAPHLAVNP